MAINVSITAIENVVNKIRDWELDAGEGFCDYFLDSYSYCGRWKEFLLSKGYDDLVAKIEADVYVLRDGTRFESTDQELKFEPHSRAHENEGGDWDEDIYRKDVALWAEFILLHEDIYTEFNEFLEENN